MPPTATAGNYRGKAEQRPLATIPVSFTAYRLHTRLILRDYMCTWPILIPARLIRDITLGPRVRDSLLNLKMLIQIKTGRGLGLEIILGQISDQIAIPRDLTKPESGSLYDPM